MPQLPGSNDDEHFTIHAAHRPAPAVAEHQRRGLLPRHRSYELRTPTMRLSASLLPHSGEKVAEGRIRGAFRTAQAFRTWRPIVGALQTPASTTPTDCACTPSNRSLGAASDFPNSSKRSCSDRCWSDHAAGRNRIRKNEPDPFSRRTPRARCPWRSSTVRAGRPWRRCRVPRPVAAARTCAC